MATAAAAAGEESGARAASTRTREAAATRWCFTINNYTDEDKFWENDEQRAEIKYLIVQHEVGAQGTPHLQGFLILKKKNRMTWLKSNINNRAHWEKARGSDQQAADYCRKDESHPDGSLRVEIGQLRTGTRRLEREDLEDCCIEEMEQVRDCFKQPRDIAVQALMKPGFIAAYNILTSDATGPYRPKLKIITLIGRPGTGKSFTINALFPKIARAQYGNGGLWWVNPCEQAAVIEEFNGQIKLQQMLKLLDPYPMSLEIKGGYRPALFETLFITSNTAPSGWYKAEENSEGKRSDALAALYDRLGYVRLERTCGHYLEAPGTLTIVQTRRWFMQNVKHILGMPLDEDDYIPSASLLHPFA